MDRAIPMPNWIFIQVASGYSYIFQPFNCSDDYSMMSNRILLYCVLIHLLVSWHDNALQPNIEFLLSFQIIKSSAMAAKKC